jgi:hypothetical protein
MTKKYALALGIGLAVVAGVGVLSVRAAEEAPAAPDVKKLADEVGKKDWADLSKDGEAISKKYTDLIDVMGVFKLRKTEGKGTSGIGIGKTPGAILPDGIEAKILNLSKAVRKGDLEKADDLKRMAEIAAAVAGITIHMPNEDAKKTQQDTKKWQEYSKDMHDASKELIKSLDGKSSNPAQVKAAALKLQNACTACHNDYRK